MPTVSIIVPVYNVLPYLEKCVDSLVKQTYPDIEIILVDDGSTDGSAELCDSFTDPRIRVIHKKNGGLSSARNAGIIASRGQYLSFVDSDDYVTHDCVKYLLELMLLDKNAGISACAHYVARGDRVTPSTDYRGTLVLDKKQVFDLVLYHNKVDVCAWAKLYKRHLFDSIRYPDGLLYEDTFIFADVVSAAGTFVFGGEPKYFYVQRQSSIVNGGFSQQRLQYIAAVDKMLGTVIRQYPELNDGCRRRINHARLSVLRYMGNCYREHIDLCHALRRDILHDAWAVLCDPRAPAHHKIALVALFFGLRPYFFAWRLYKH